MDNKSIVLHLLEEVDKGNLDVVDECFARDYVDHNRVAIPNLATGIDGVKQAFSLLQAAFPDASHTVDDIVAEGDKVVARISARGTHTGDLFGVAPTGKEIKLSGIAIYRLAEGKIVERWAEQSGSVLQQLGISNAPGYAT